MIYLKLTLVVSVLKISDGVKVNMQGSLTLGREVVDTLTHFINKNKLSGRRSFGFGAAEDENADSDTNTISLIVNSAFLCRDIEFCRGDIGTTVNNYIIVLTKAVESVFEGLIDDADKKQNDNTAKVVIFEEELRRLIQDTKKLLLKANEKISEGNEAFTWINLIKRINAKFQERAINFASQRLEGNADEISEVKQKLTQKLVTATSLVELKFETTLCVDHNICSAKNNECTKALNTLLVQMKTVSDDRAKEFIRYFYETLPNTNFFYRVSDITGHEFQSILHDMGYAENIPTQKVLSIIQKTVEDRLNAVNSNYQKYETNSGRDVQLLHVILSDMDHFYNKLKKEPFHDFLSDFFEWSKVGGRFSSPLRHVMKDIQNQLSYESDELVMKLINEVRVFMEITVDPET